MCIARHARVCSVGSAREPQRTGLTSLLARRRSSAPRRDNSPAEIMFIDETTGGKQILWRAAMMPNWHRLRLRTAAYAWILRSDMEDPVSAISNSGQANPEAAPSSRTIIDYLLFKADARRVSIRKLGELAGINHSRCARILHKDPARRHAIKIYELTQILDVLDVEFIEAALANDAWRQDPVIPHASVERAAILASEFVRGLPAKIIGIVSDIQGLDCLDIRKEQGRPLRSLIIQVISKQYAEIARRRDVRIDFDYKI
jgi:hypothetical protein